MNATKTEDCLTKTAPCNSDIDNVCCFLLIAVTYLQKFRYRRAAFFFFNDNVQEYRQTARVMAENFIESRIYSLNSMPPVEKLENIIDTNLFFVWWDIRYSENSSTNGIAGAFLNRMISLQLVKPPKIWVIVSTVIQDPEYLFEFIDVTPVSIIAFIVKADEDDYFVYDVYGVDQNCTATKDLIGELKAVGNYFHYNEMRTFPKIIRGMRNYSLKVGALRRPPFVDYYPEENRLTGLLGQVLLLTQKFHSIVYDIHLSGEDEISKRRDIFDELNPLYNLSDLILGVHTMSKDRYVKYTYTNTVAFGRYLIVFQRPDRIRFTSGFTAPFTKLTWILIAVICLFVAVQLRLTHMKPVFINGRLKSPKTIFKSPTASFQDKLFISFGALMQRGTEFPPKDLPSRIIWCTFFVFTLIIFSSYASVLFSFLTLYGEQWPFTSLNNLLNNTKYNITGIMNSSSYYRYQKAKSGINFKIKNRIAAYVAGAKEGVEYVYNHPTAVFIDHDVQVIPFLRDNCSFRSLPMGIYYRHGFHLVFKKHHPLRRVFDSVVCAMQERGVLQKEMAPLQWNAEAFCNRPPKNDPISLGEVSELFSAWLIGISLAICVFTIECLIDRCLALKRKKRNIPKKMRNSLITRKIVLKRKRHFAKHSATRLEYDF